MTAKIEALGVTSASALLGCRRRIELARVRAGSSSGGSVAVAPALGDLCHEALQQLTESREILGDGWREALRAVWEEALERLTISFGQEVDPETWPGYKLARARVEGVASRLREMLLPLGEEVELVCEQRMEALGARLVGKPDLVVLASDVHWILDYKTGAVLEVETRLPSRAYVAQLQLYAVLERERSGSWPSSGYLLPFKQATVEVPLVAEECAALAATVVTTLEEYNQTAPAVQPASPLPENCQWCPHPTFCDQVWTAGEDSWAPQVSLAEGTLVQAARSQVGLLTMVVDLTGGTLGVGRVAIKADPAVVGCASSLVPGTRLRASGLRRQGEHTFSLAPWSELRVDAS